MPAPVKNTCTPSNVYGGFSQTLFLGCSVMSFSASAGWNEQTAEVNVQLVRDSCEAPATAPKRYYDTNLSAQTTTDADPGFFGLTTNIIGAPVYFRVADFEFAGIVQTWEESSSDSGNPTYTVKIVDPRHILEGTHIIINEYAGSVGSIYNLLNVFGYAESQGSACSPSPFTAGTYYQSAPGVYSAGSGSADGPVFGSPASAFGGADANRNGMQWNQILSSTRRLASSIPLLINQFSPYGRLAFKAPGTYPATGMGIMPADVGNLAYYFIDLEEVPTAPSYWRLNGTSVGLMEAITQICQDSGHDYYVELIPVVDSLMGPGIHKFIKVRTVDRTNAPALNAIETFVGDAGREVISYNIGRELRNDTTSAFVIGGPKQSFYQAEQSYDPEGDGQPTPPEADDMIIPFFGLDPSTGDAIIPTKTAEGWWTFEAPSEDLSLQLLDVKYGKAVPTSLTIEEPELVCALAGIDTWMAWASEQQTDLWQALNVQMQGVWNVQHIVDFLKNVVVNQGQLRPADMMALRQGVFQPHDNENVDLEVIDIGFAWIEKYAKGYYGKTYQVRVPFTCGKVDSESGIVMTSEEPTDGGWTEVSPVLGLSHPSVLTDFFSLDDNRLGAFCRFDNGNGIQVTNLDVNDYVTTGGKLWVKVQVEPEYIYYDKSTLFSPRAVITLPQQVLGIKNKANLQFGALNDLVTKFQEDLRAGPIEQVEDRVDDIQKHVGNLTTHLATQQFAVVPDAAGFGIKSNVLKYGPWGSAGPAGAVSVINDEGLVPWEYGGFSTMDMAGDSIANAGVTNTQVLEEGSITVAGYPELPLGAELLASDAGGPFNGGGNNLLENRTGSSGTVFGGTYWQVPVYQWDGTYGPNVTGLTTQVGADGLTTTYNLRTWSPKFGVFARGNAERLKQIGQRKLQQQKQLRAWSFNRLRRGAFYRALGAAAERQAVKINEGAMAAPKTPHEVLVGEQIHWNEQQYTRPLVSSNSTPELPVDMADNYDKKAFMSLDGLLRPVSLYGSGGLTPYAVPGSNCQTTTSRGAQPPVDKPGYAGSLYQYNIDHSQKYLNPFANPSSDLANRSDTPNHGHDIELIGRGSSPPASSMMMPIQGYANSSGMEESDYYSDYRLLALRGPLIMKSWGYDLDGFPIPNKIDTPAAISGGIYADSGLTDKFMDNWLRKSESWPVAPIDLRYDRARGVWTIPQYRNIVAQVSGNLSPYGSVVGVQLSGPQLYDTDGYPIDEPHIILHDEVGNSCVSSGDIVIAEFDPYECRYRIIESKNVNSVLDLCCSGQYSVNNPCSTLSDWCTIYTRSGIRGTTSDNKLFLDSTQRIADTNDCYPPSGWPRAQIGNLLNWETISFGAGLWITPAFGPGGPGLGSVSSSADTGCLYHIQAGFSPLNNHSLCNRSGILTTDGTRYINTVDFQGGLRALDGPNTCDLLLRAGISPINDSSKCINNIESDPDSSDIFNKIEFVQGIRAKDDDPTDCKIQVGAGITAYNTNLCYYPNTTPDVSDLYNDIKFGKGLLSGKNPLNPCELQLNAGVDYTNSAGCVTGYVDSNPSPVRNHIYFKDGIKAQDSISDPCGLEIGAGVYFESSSACVTGTVNSNKLVNKIQLGKGLRGETSGDEDCTVTLGAGFNITYHNNCVDSSEIGIGPYSTLMAGKGLNIRESSDCVAEIGLLLNIGGVEAAQISVGNCLEVIDAGSCTALLKLKESYGNGTIAVSQNVMTGLTFTCCPSGGIKEASYSYSTMNYNSCGQLISITPGTGTWTDCECENWEELIADNTGNPIP